MIKTIGFVFLEIFKTVTQYPVFVGALKSYFFMRKLKKSFKKNGEVSGVMNIAKHAVKDLTESKDIEFSIRKLNADKEFYNYLTVSRSGDYIKLQIGENEIEYNIKNKNVDWAKIGKLL